MGALKGREGTLHVVLQAQFPKTSKIKTSSRNGLRRYPELLPHQLRPISTYPNPPISHIRKNANFLLLFPIISPPGGAPSTVISNSAVGAAGAAVAVASAAAGPPAEDAEADKEIGRSSIP